MARKLTTKQKRYCAARAAGKGYKEAYAAAGYSTNSNDHVITTNAYNMETNNNDILMKIKELQARADSGGILQRRERMQLLTDIAMNTSVKDTDRLRALDILARMNSDYTDKITVSGSADITMTYAERMQAIKQGLENDL